MTGWVLLALLLAFPLVSWALLARTRATGMIVGTVLLGCTAAEVAATAGHADRILVAVVLPAAMAVVLLAGFLAEGPRFSGRGAAGALVWFFYCVGCLASYGIYATGTGWETNYHNGVGMPAASDVLPLGPGLAATQKNLGCGTGEWTTCTIEFFVHGTAGQSQAALLNQVTGDLGRAHGWSVGHPGADPWKSCLQRGDQVVCVQINPLPTEVEVYLAGYPDSQS